MHTIIPLFVDWQPRTEAFHLGPLSVRWYALCWMAGLLAAYLIVRRLYRLEGLDPRPSPHGTGESTGLFDPLFLYCFIGVIAGARLGHCLFYEPGYFLSSPRTVCEMLLPVRIDAGWHFRLTGYAGLASHGGVIGLLAGLLLYVRRKRVPCLMVLDMVAVAAPCTAALIRLGNLMNSEILGLPTRLPWGFIFHTREGLVDGSLGPRHPAQLYEAAAYALIFAAMWWVYRRGAARTRVGRGFLFGLCLAAIFTFRLVIEQCKEVQGGADDGSTVLDMGQMLSLPLIIAGAAFMARACLKRR